MFCILCDGQQDHEQNCLSTLAAGIDLNDLPAWLLTTSAWTGAYHKFGSSSEVISAIKKQWAADNAFERERIATVICSYLNQRGLMTGGLFDCGNFGFIRVWFGTENDEVQSRWHHEWFEEAIDLEQIC